MAPTVSSALLGSVPKGFVASKGLQVVLEKQPTTTSNTVDKAPTSLCEQHVCHAATPSTPKHEPSPLLDMKTPAGAVELFMGVVRLIKYSVSTLIPFGISFQFSFGSSSASTPNEPKEEEPLLVPHTRPEDQEDEILRELCSGVVPHHPLIFSARSMESYLQARKASEVNKERRSSFDLHLSDLTSHLSVDLQKTLLKAVDQIFRPVSTLATERVWSRVPSAPAGCDAEQSSRKNDWAKMGATIMGVVLLVDTVLLTVFYLTN
eukprot:comp11929_c0_seq1/m.6595 comp11929_c0_seq1/g.6595  ORF comp11929_c0_seq1/g.6595 comp11929_c0_seq1/m.6595 type:complete len:263 (-) comp11929_c0_seq1:432-1220(-)